LEIKPSLDPDQFHQPPLERSASGEGDCPQSPLSYTRAVLKILVRGGISDVPEVEDNLPPLDFSLRLDQM